MPRILGDIAKNAAKIKIQISVFNIYLKLVINPKKLNKLIGNKIKIPVNVLNKNGIKGSIWEALCVSLISDMPATNSVIFHIIVYKTCLILSKKFKLLNRDFST